jgi:two-component system osmolarity sensor histidine kinase EnvZ
MMRRLFPRLVLLLVAVLVVTTGVGLLGLRLLTHDAAIDYAGQGLAARVFAADTLLGRDDRDSAGERLRALGIDYVDRAPDAGPVLVPFHRDIERDLAARLPGRDLRVTESPEPVLWIATVDGRGAIGIPLLALRAPLRWTTVLWLLAGALIVLAAAAWAARGLVLPLRTLADAAPGLLAGAAPPPWPPGAATELAELSAAFERAAADTRSAAQERGLMLAGLSHDMRTPLARLVVALELLDGVDPSIRAGMQADIAELDAILDQFVAFVRDGRDEAAVEVDLGSLLDDALAAQRRGGHAFARTGEAHVAVRGKPMALRRAVDNLLGNAVRHGHAPREVALQRDGAAAVICVRDRGPGVPAAQLAELGRPFYRADAARSTPGSGLGLATVARVAAWHDGGLVLANRDGGGFEARLRVVAARA